MLSPFESLSDSKSLDNVLTQRSIKAGFQLPMAKFLVSDRSRLNFNRNTFPAAIFIVNHMSEHAHDQQAFKIGNIYLAPPDQHMFIVKGKILITKRARENRSRPAIDPLFRSAAVAYGNRVVGIILTGYLGHAFTSSALVAQQTAKIEETLWVALRMFDERQNLLVTMSKNESKQSSSSISLRANVTVCNRALSLVV